MARWLGWVTFVKTTVMSRFLNLLNHDIRFVEGLKACMSCGVCTAICPASAVFDYDPRKICMMVQSGNDGVIENLLASDTIWYCGQCMSCRTRCPRGNTPGYIIQALRKLSVETGLYLHSEEGRKQKLLAQTIGGNLVKKGYCVDADLVVPEGHPEQGPVWQWVYDNRVAVFEKCGGNYHGAGPGAQRTMDAQTMQELNDILSLTGAHAWLNRLTGETQTESEKTTADEFAQTK